MQHSMHGTYIICVRIPASYRLEFDNKVFNLATLNISCTWLHFVNFLLAEQDRGQPRGLLVHVCKYVIACSCMLVPVCVNAHAHT